MRVTRLQTALSMRWVAKALGLFAVAAGLACAGCNTQTPFLGVNPLEANLAPLPTQAGDPYPETLSALTGKKDAYSWAHGKGYVKASPAAVWKALQDPNVVIDRKNTDTQSVQLHSEPKYAWSYKIHYTAGNGFAEWWENWRFAVVDGTFEAPTTGLIRYQKTDGSTYIDLIEGSIYVRAIDGQGGVAIVEMINHVKAVGQGADNAKATLDAQYGALLAKVKGKPLP